MIERLDDRRPVEPLLHDLAAAIPVVFEQFPHAVGRRPVVHRVHHDLPGHQGWVEVLEPVNRDRQHHEIGVGDRVGCPARLRSRHQDSGDELDPLRLGGTRDRHVVARGDRDTRDHRTDVPGPEDCEPR